MGGVGYTFLKCSLCYVSGVPNHVILFPTYQDIEVCIFISLYALMSGEVVLNNWIATNNYFY